MFKAIINANVVKHDGILFDGIIVIKDNRIFDISKDEKTSKQVQKSLMQREKSQTLCL